MFKSCCEHKPTDKGRNHTEDLQRGSFLVSLWGCRAIVTSLFGNVKLRCQCPFSLRVHCRAQLFSYCARLFFHAVICNMFVRIFGIKVLVTKKKKKKKKKKKERKDGVWMRKARDITKERHTRMSRLAQRLPISRPSDLS